MSFMLNTSARFRNVSCAGLWSLESKGFSIREVGVKENVNDSNSGLTFNSPIVTVCATNVHKHDTWQFSKPGPVK